MIQFYTTVKQALWGGVWTAVLNAIVRLFPRLHARCCCFLEWPPCWCYSVAHKLPPPPHSSITRLIKGSNAVVVPLHVCHHLTSMITSVWEGGPYSWQLLSRLSRTQWRRKKQSPDLPTLIPLPTPHWSLILQIPILGWLDGSVVKCVCWSSERLDLSSQHMSQEIWHSLTPSLGTHTQVACSHT